MSFDTRRALIGLATAGALVLTPPMLGVTQESYAANSTAPFTVHQDGNNDNTFDDDDNEAIAGDNDDANLNDNAEVAGDNDNSSNNDNEGDIAGTGDETWFLRNAVSDSATEIRSGQLAMSNAADSDVRQLGERMINEHNAVIQDALNVATRYGEAPPAAPTDDDELTRVADLSNRTGADFDRAYLQAVIRDQRAEIDTYNFARATMRDDVAEYAGRQLWTIEQQLRAAEDLANRLGVDVSSF